jgi:hypothetical protein
MAQNPKMYFFKNISNAVLLERVEGVEDGHFSFKIDKFDAYPGSEEVFELVEEYADLFVWMPDVSFDFPARTFKFGNLETQLDGIANDYGIRPTSSLYFSEDTETYSIDMSVFLLYGGCYRSFTIECQWNSQEPVGTKIIASSYVL